MAACVAACSSFALLDLVDVFPNASAIDDIALSVLPWCLRPWIATMLSQEASLQVSPHFVLIFAYPFMHGRFVLCDVSGLTIWYTSSLALKTKAASNNFLERDPQEP